MEILMDLTVFVKVKQSQFIGVQGSAFRVLRKESQGQRHGFVIPVKTGIQSFW
jgi:hypothetical protein